MGSNRKAWATCAVAVMVAAGCGGGLSHGTGGRLTTDGQPLADFQLTVVNSGGNVVAMAFTEADGRFTLVTADASGPVTLPPGRYAVAVESVGSDVTVPAEYGAAETTPLTVDWSGEGRLPLDVPGVLPSGGAGR